MSNALNIAIIVGSTREGRVSPQVAAWVKEQASQRENVNYDIVDIKAFKLPLLGESEDTTGIVKWNQTLAKYDGFVFVVAEYNHSLTGSLKNALDLAKDPWNNKAAGIVSYGSIGGARAAEALRLILGELQIADVRTQVLLSLFTDFENYTTFKPLDLHLNNLTTLFDQVEAWSKALKPLRK